MAEEIHPAGNYLPIFDSIYIVIKIMDNIRYVNLCNVSKKDYRLSLCVQITCAI